MQMKKLIFTILVLTLAFATQAQAAVTVSDYQQSTWSDSTAYTSDEVTPTLTWSAGDLIVVMGSSEGGQFRFNTPTATGLTFSLATTTNLGNSSGYAKTWMWTATAAGAGSSAVTTTRADTGTGAVGIAAFSYSGTDGIGNITVQNHTSAKVIPLVRSAANSAAVVVLADWNAINDVTVTSDPAGGTQRVAQNVASHYTTFLFNWGDQGAAGTTSYGITDHTGTVLMDGIVAEVKVATGAPATSYGSPKVTLQGQLQIKGNLIIK